jgi:hypothetical protein
MLDAIVLADELHRSKWRRLVAAPEDIAVAPDALRTRRAAGEPADEAEPGTLRLLRVVGTGVYGTVFEAEHSRVGRCAVKAVPLVDPSVWEELQWPPWDEGDAVSPKEVCRHFARWQAAMRAEAADTSNAALSECAFQRLVARPAPAAPWFTRFHGAWCVGRLELGQAGAPPRGGRRAAAAAFVEQRLRVHTRVVREFEVRVPHVLICTGFCEEGVDDWLRPLLTEAGRGGSLLAVPWAEIGATVAHAFCAAMHLKRLRLTHNDFHLANLMTVPAPAATVRVDAARRRFALPTHGRLLKVVDFGLCTGRLRGSTPEVGGKRKRGRELNSNSLAAIRYRTNDPMVDMRTLLLDLATAGDFVMPAATGCPRHAEALAASPHYAVLCESIRTFTRSASDPPGERPWLLRLLDSPAELQREVVEINRADAVEPVADEEEIEGTSPSGLMLAIRRVANSKRHRGRQRLPPPAEVMQLMLGQFELPEGEVDPAGGEAPHELHLPT